MNELYELKDGMYWNVEPEEVITQYIWYLKNKNKEQKEILNKIKEELNNLYNADQSERNYKVFIEKIDKLLEEINGRNI
jgi:conjugal transfer/entry exclusion protein